MIERNTYSRKIKPTEFCKILDHAKQFFKRKCDEESDETTL